MNVGSAVKVKQQILDTLGIRNNWSEQFVSLSAFRGEELWAVLLLVRIRHGSKNDSSEPSDALSFLILITHWYQWDYQFISKWGSDPPSEQVPCIQQQTKLNSQPLKQQWPCRGLKILTSTLMALIIRPNSNLPFVCEVLAIEAAIQLSVCLSREGLCERLQSVFM